MSSEHYTPGHSQNAADFMSQRTLGSHGQFFMPYLDTDLSVLDCGCGPGTITLGIASQVAPGEVVGIDFGASQVDQAIARSAQQNVGNVRFEVASCYELPFDDASFDRVFSHALMEHLATPVRALQECFRVLKPGGWIGVCSPDWSGFLLSPPSVQLSQAVEAYVALQSQNGGDVNVGQKLGSHLEAAGFETAQMHARYECYPSLEFIGEYLALQLERAGDLQSARTLRVWSQQPGGMFAQAWVSAVATKAASVC